MFRLLALIVIVISLAANIWLVKQWRAAASASPPSRPVPSQPAVKMAPAPAPDILATAPAVNPNPSTAAEFRTLRTQLEALGLSSDAVRAALTMVIHQSFQRRRDALVPQPGPDEYWRNPGGRLDLADPAALRALELEQRQVVREIMREGLDSDSIAQQRQFGGLPEEKVTALKRIFADYSDLEEQLYTDGVDRSSPEYRARALFLAKEKRADLERALTPDELYHYDLRNSTAAHRLRGQLGQFAATEAEFLALYPTYKAVLDATTGGPDSPSSFNQAESRRTRETTAQRLDTELRRVLGDARYAEMKEANDHLLQQTRAFTASVNLPPAAAAEVIAVQKEFSPKLSAIDRNRDLTANQRDAQASALGIEARDRLIQVLGPEHFEAYKRRGGGWLGSALNRAPPTASPAP